MTWDQGQPAHVIALLEKRRAYLKQLKTVREYLELCESIAQLKDDSVNVRALREEHGASLYAPAEYDARVGQALAEREQVSTDQSDQPAEEVSAS